MQPVLYAREITKRFGSTVALDSVSIELLPSEVHVVLGENGAGKSTLVGVLSGNLDFDYGEMQGGGRGIGVVHQHFALVPAFTVSENIALATNRNAVLLDADEESKAAFETARGLGWELPNARTGLLGVGVQQRIEIVKALVQGSRAVLFDEPTAALTSSETKELFRVIEKIRAEGRGVVLITHKLDEALAIADRITVLRKGKVVASVLRENASASQLAEWMVGDIPAHLTRSETHIGEVTVKAENLRVTGDRGNAAVDGVSFEIRAGEVLGFGGVDGNGQVELAEALAGIRHPSSGGLKAPAAAYIPQDRQRDGLALDMSIEENLLISDSSQGFLSRRGVREWANKLIAEFDIRSDSAARPARSLSGGNQQKVVVARALASKARFIVATNPTRGLDIRAENYVHSALLGARDSGAAVALFSADLDELAKIADRTVFMSSGRILQGGDVGEMMGGRE